MSLVEKSARTLALDSVLTKEEWVSMLQASEDGKDQIILCLGVLGLRASEIGACRREWVDIAQQTVHLPTGATKRSKGRVVPFGKLRIVRDVIASFFIMEKEVGLSRVAVFQRVKRLASRAGILHSVTPHGLRATGATWFSQSGYTAVGLMMHFGWSELRTAEYYVQASGAAALRDMERCGEDVI